MITIEGVLSKKNQKRAFDHLSTKKNGAGVDNIPLTDLRDYWSMNNIIIREEIISGTYQPGLVLEYTIINGKGKQRNVTKFTTIDRFITRLLSQKLEEFYNPLFLEKSFAYIDGRGIQCATECARDYIELGNEFVVEIDIKNFFDSISIDKLFQLIKKEIRDEKVLNLIEKYLRCSVSMDGEVYKKEIGIIQGSSMSPVLSNIYLHNLDVYMEEKGYNWLRFADNINIYVSSEEEGEQVYSDIYKQLENEFLLHINEQKSGVYDVYERWLLGYEFHKRGNKVLVNRHVYQKKGYYRDWHPCVARKVNQEYHILQNGILNKKDYALLFENSDEKHHIPVEATEQLNIYNEVMLTSSVIRTIANENIRLAFYDSYGDLLGYFVPESFTKDAKTSLAQCEEYSNEKKRLHMAKNMEMAAIHNIRANIRYYQKQGKALSEEVTALSNSIAKMNECKSIDELLLIEARCRQMYYHSFNIILNNPAFKFEMRTKRPPRDNINALISFGNTVLYNKIQQIIWKTTLDSRIGVFHSANKRHHSLNLDFADIFKPVIVDRVIFTLINRGQLHDGEFIHNEDGSVYLNDIGKKIFIQAFDDKLRSKVTINDHPYSYYQVLENEIRAYARHIIKGEKYKAYKYY